MHIDCDVEVKVDRPEPQAICPLCSAAGATALVRHSNFANASIHECAQCTHRFCWPEPSLEDLSAHYRNAYSSGRANHFGAEYCLMMRRRAEAQVSLINRHVPVGRGVDLGCGIGALVWRLGQGGWSATGFDGDPAAVEYGTRAFGANIQLGFMQELEQSGVKPDLICMSHVVEHFGDLKNTLRRVSLRVRPGGHLFIEVPNDTIIRPGDHESHLHFFTTRTLRAVLGEVGLEIVFCQSCGPTHEDTDVGSPGTFLSRLRAGLRRLRRRTVWDGHYDRYRDDGQGIWIRCIARVPPNRSYA